MSASLRMYWTESKDCAQYFAQAHSKCKGKDSHLNFKPSWTSAYNTPHEANKILCHQLYNFTLTKSSQTIRDLERLKGLHLLKQQIFVIAIIQGNFKSQIILLNLNFDIFTFRWLQSIPELIRKILEFLFLKFNSQPKT